MEPSLPCAGALCAYLLLFAPLGARAAWSPVAALRLASWPFAAVALGLVLPRGGAAGHTVLAVGAGGALGAALLAATVIAGAGEHVPFAVGEVDQLEGVLVDDAAVTAGGLRYAVAVDWVAVSARGAGGSARMVLRLTAAHDDGSMELAYRGQRVQVSGVRLRRRGGAGGAALTAGHGVGVAAGGSPRVTPGAFSGPITRVRAQVRQQLERHVLAVGGRGAPLLAALLLGDRHHLAPQEVAAFRRSGSMHLLALSGLHVGMAYGMTLAVGNAVALAGALVVPRWRRAWLVLATVLAVVGVFLYVELVGSRASLARAAFMVAIARLAASCGRPTSSRNILALAAVLVLVCDASAVHGLSFQLSFLALLGIVQAGPWVADRLPAVLPPALRSLIGMAVGAQAATLPLVLARFGVAYPIGALASLALVPCTTLFLWAGVVGMAVSAVLGQPALAVTSIVLDALYSALTMLNELFALAPGIRL